jgi:hypothetical protein
MQATRLPEVRVLCARNSDAKASLSLWRVKIPSFQRVVDDREIPVAEISAEFLDPNSEPLLQKGHITEVLSLYSPA